MALDILDPKSVKEAAEKRVATQTKNNLKVIFLGGVGEIGKNMTVLEYGNELIVIDTGLAFPGDEMPGIDLVVQDITYLINNKDKVKAIILTHGHEDHIGALPYVLSQLNMAVPVYGSRFTLGIIENKLREHPGLKIKAIGVKARSVIRIGASFGVEFIHVNHSIPGSFALAISTPVGMVFHSGDFKIDHTPVDGNPIDMARISELGKKGVRLLMCESTNIEHPGSTKSETTVGAQLDDIFLENKDKRIFVATFASNVHRVQQLLELADKYKRKVAFGGRSMINIMDIALKLNEMKATKTNLIELNNIKNFANGELLIVLTGSQGEHMSALSRMARGDFPRIDIGPTDLVILSSHAIPGNEKSVNNMINNLFKRGADVVYEDGEEVHQSGHAYQDELKMVHLLLKPQFFIPVHGEYKHLKKHADLAKKLGMNERNIIKPDLGDVVEINQNMMKRAGSVPAGLKFIDGLGVGEADSYVLRDRMQLAEEGICVIGIGANSVTGELASGPDIITRGLLYSAENEVIAECKGQVLEHLKSVNFKTEDLVELRQKLRQKLGDFLYKRFKRRPMILTIVQEVK